QSEVENILAAKHSPHTIEPTWRGRNLSDVLRRGGISTNPPAIDELLTLHQLAAGDDPETLTLETPLECDTLPHPRKHFLFVDPFSGKGYDEDSMAVKSDCQRGTNGNCLLVWNTIYETPGRHALQLALLPEAFNPREPFVRGPIAPFVVSNLCQFGLP